MTSILLSAYSKRVSEVQLRSKALFCFIAFLLLNATAMISQEAVHSLPESSVWLRPEITKGAFYAPAQCIGNYKVYEANSPEVAAVFAKVGAFKAGTLFIVGDFPEGDSLVRLGKICIGSNVSYAGQNELVYDSLSGKPVILKLSYGISPKYKKPDFESYFHEDFRLAEVLFFEHTLSEEKARQVETYLALKYSINITENKESKLRNYVSTDDQKLWNYSADGLYDQEVLGLGRNDLFEFYQTQTFSADAERIWLSFSETPSLGAMPNFELANESFVVLSRKQESLIKTNCGGSAHIQPWKLHFQNWNTSNPGKAYLWFDSIIELAHPPMLTNGSTSIVLAFEASAGGTKITLPLEGLNHALDYYVILETANSCQPIANLEVVKCDLPQGVDNGLKFHINDEGLGADITLTNTTTKEQFVFAMTENNGNIDNLSSGQYEILVQAQNRVLINQVIWFDACGGGSDDPLSPPSFSQAADPKNNQSAQSSGGDRGIIAYPNPIRAQDEVVFQMWGLEGEVFTVQITDNNGRVMLSTQYKSEEGVTPFSHHFSHVGTYNVSFKSSNYTEVLSIVIQ